MAWTTPINWLAKAVGYKVTRADMQTISNSLNAVGDTACGTGPTAPGWFDDSDTWVYVSATSFKVVGKDVRKRFLPGTKIYCVQTTNKWFYVTGTAYSSDTTVTVTGGSDYSLANAAITTPRYSYLNVAVNFPAGFNVTPSGEVGWAGTPTYTLSYLTITGQLATYSFDITGTSNSIETQIELPITPAKTVFTSCAVSQDNGAYIDADCKIQINTGIITFYKSGATDTWTASGTKTVRGQISFPI